MKVGFTGPQNFRGFPETGPRAAWVGGKFPRLLVS